MEMTSADGNGNAVVRLDDRDLATSELRSYWADTFSLHMHLPFLQPGLHTAEVVLYEKNRTKLGSDSVAFTLGDEHCEETSLPPWEEAQDSVQPNMEGICNLAVNQVRARLEQAL